MKLINFDEKFEAYLRTWMEKHGDEYGGNVDRMEQAIPDVYLAFLETEDPEIGMPPLNYFDQFEDPETLVNMLKQYHDENVPIPDLLLERIVSVGKSVEVSLVRIALDATQDEEMRMTAVSLLQEIGSVMPMQGYIDMIAGMEGPSNLCDICGESLVAMGEMVIPGLLEKYEAAGDSARDVIADVLSNFKENDSILEVLLERFRNRPENLALFASYLAKYGDDRALPDLQDVCADPALGYLDFLEIANAIESLGGDRPADRDFSGDPYYEALAGMESQE